MLRVATADVSTRVIINNVVAFFLPLAVDLDGRVVVDVIATLSFQWWPFVVH